MNPDKNHPEAGRPEKETRKTGSLTLIEKARQWLAVWLDKHVNGLPAYIQKALLITSGVAIGCACLWMILSSIAGEVRPSFSIDRITLPENIHRNYNEKAHPNGEPDKLLHLLHFLDSLNQNKEGKLLFDSILRPHPGLQDSLAWFLHSSENKSNH